VIGVKRLVTAVLALLVVGAGVLTWHEASYDEPAVVQPKVLKDGRYRVGTVGDSDSRAAIKAAVATLPVAFSYDYRSLDKSVDSATSKMTPGFGAEFRDTFDKTIRAMATEKKAITSALVRAAGVVGTVKNNRATVLVYLDQVLVSSKAKKASDPLKVSQNRVHVSLRKVDGHWLVSDIEPF